MSHAAGDCDLHNAETFLTIPRGVGLTFPPQLMQKKKKKKDVFLLLNNAKVPLPFRFSLVFVWNEVTFYLGSREQLQFYHLVII